MQIMTLQEVDADPPGGINATPNALKECYERRPSEIFSEGICSLRLPLRAEARC